MNPRFSSLLASAAVAAAAVAAALPGLALAHSFDAGDLHIGHPWARPSVAQQTSGAAYISIENRGKAADTLVRASTPVAKEVQVHSMKMDGNVMRMREVPKLEVPAATMVAMKPGDGYHLMLVGLKQPLKAGERFPLTLVFEKAGQAEVTVVVEDKPRDKAAASTPAAGQHKH
ncbi:MAG: rane protein [Paucimonas sp.]|nr:rane protein [Paucimonas sp.]